MKRFLLATLVILSFLGASATSQQTINDLRAQITLLLSKENMKPQMDGPNIEFNEDGIYHVAYIYDRKDDAKVINISTSWNYDDIFTREVVSNLAPAVSRIDGVKLLIDDSGYRYESDFIYTDKEHLATQIKQCLKAQAQVNQELFTMVHQDLGNVDFTKPTEDLYTAGFVKWILDKNDAARSIAEYLVKSKSPKGYALMAILYENGAGVPVNPEKMVQNYQKALDGGELWCAYTLGQYYYGKGNYKKAYDYFIQGTTDSPFNNRRSASYNMLGKMLENGDGITQDLEQATSNYRKSVEYATEMECEARKALARLGVPMEKPSDFTDATKIMLANMSAEDMYQRGLEYEKGLNDRGISLPKAFAYFKAASERNHDLATLKMAEIYRSPYYPFNDASTSDKYYSKAYKSLSRRQNIDPKAAYNLGLMYKNGYSVKADAEEARNYFSKAAASVPEANYELGVIYQEQDLSKEAFDYFLKAAEEDIEPAMFAVAVAYETGKGTSKDLDEARRWYKRCADYDGENSDAANKALAALTRPVKSKS